MVGGSVPATALTTAFHVPDLGLRVAFIGPEQSQSALGSMPQGALVMEVESSGTASKAGIHVFDTAIKSKPWMTCVKPFVNSVPGKLHS